MVPEKVMRHLEGLLRPFFDKYDQDSNNRLDKGEFWGVFHDLHEQPTTAVSRAALAPTMSRVEVESTVAPMIGCLPDESSHVLVPVIITPCYAAGARRYLQRNRHGQVRGRGLQGVCDGRGSVRDEQVAERCSQVSGSCDRGCGGIIGVSHRIGWAREPVFRWRLGTLSGGQCVSPDWMLAARGVLASGAEYCSCMSWSTNRSARVCHSPSLGALAVLCRVVQ